MNNDNPYTDSNGSRYWCLHGEIHREDGPAVITNHGDQYWYINGDRYKSSKAYQEAAKLTDQEMMILILKYGCVG